MAVWRVSGGFRVSCRCLAAVWRVSGGFLKGVWRVSTGQVRAGLEASRERSSQVGTGQVKFKSVTHNFLRPKYVNTQPFF